MKGRWFYIPTYSLGPHTVASFWKIARGLTVLTHNKTSLFEHRIPRVWRLIWAHLRPHVQTHLYECGSYGPANLGLIGYLSWGFLWAILNLVFFVSASFPQTFKSNMEPQQLVPSCGFSLEWILLRCVLCWIRIINQKHISVCSEIWMCLCGICEWWWHRFQKHIISCHSTWSAPAHVATATTTCQCGKK